MAKQKPILKSFTVSLLLLAAIAFISNAAPREQSQCNPASQLNAPIPLSLKHNYIVFLDKNDKIHGELKEINGWLLLEGVLKKNLGIPIDSDLSGAIESFGRNKLIGWWPEKEMPLGKNYFPGEEPVQLYPDSDDTGWAYRYYGDYIQEDIIKSFTSYSPLPGVFPQLCQDINCQRQYIVRSWSEAEWHDDVDLVGISSFITMMNINSSLAKKVFEENKKLINFAIESREIDDYFKYYEPKSTGYFMILFHDEQGPQFLTEKSKNILFSKLRNALPELKKASLGARWGGGADWFYGCMILTLNDNIPKLMRQYADKYWDMR